MASKKSTAELKLPEEKEEVKLDAEIEQTAAKADEIAQKDAEIAALRKQLERVQLENVNYRTGNDFQRVAQAEKECEEKGIDPWTVSIPVRVPVRTDTNEKHYWLCVNSRPIQIPANDQYQEMKLPFASALMNMLNAEKYAQSFADAEIQVYDPISNPHPGENKIIR